jgi:hypothetical protein
VCWKKGHSSSSLKKAEKSVRAFSHRVGHVNTNSLPELGELEEARYAEGYYILFLTYIIF